MDDRILYLPTLGQKFWFGTDNSFTENIIQEDMELSYCFRTNNEKSSIGGSPFLGRLLQYTSNAIPGLSSGTGESAEDM